MALSEGDKGFIVEQYSANLLTMIELSEMFHVTRQAIWKVLGGAGVDTRKRRLEVECDWCGKVFRQTKKRLRKSNRHFCSNDCRCDWLNEIGMGYNPNRYGQRLGRSKVSMYFDIPEGAVVHHEDKNCLNNRWENLKVFRDQGEHVKYHRGIQGIEPIWDGYIEMGEGN